MSSRLYFRGGKSIVVGLSVSVRPEVEKKLSRVDIALVMQSGVQVPEDTKILDLHASNNVFLLREISVGVSSEDKPSGIYALVQSERVKFKPSAGVVACLRDGVPYVHSLYVPYRENLHVSVVAQLTVATSYGAIEYTKYRIIGTPVELSCVADSGEGSEFDYEKWGDTDWD